MSEMGAGAPGPGGEEFAQSRACFAELEEWLSGPGAAGLTHAGLEERLDARGRELLRLLHQDHLDLRAAREERRAGVTGADSITRTRMETGHQRGLVTVFGEVTVTRMAYRAPGAANLHPADTELNLPKKSTPTGCASWRRSSPPAVRSRPPRAITRATGAVAGKRQVEQLARRAAADVDAFYAARRPAAPA